MNLSTIKSKLSSLLRKDLARNTLWLLLGKLLRIVMQAGYFIIVARTLGAQNYGSFVSVTALSTLAFPFVGLGSEHILIKYVSHDKNLFSLYWGNTLVTLFVSGAFFTAVLLLLSPLIFADNISLLSIFLIFIANLIFLSLSDFSRKALISVERVKQAVKLGILEICIKLIAAFGLSIFFSQPTVNTWAALFLISSVIVSGISVFTVIKLIGYPKPVLSKLKLIIQEGIYFSISSSADNINSNLDKIMLASMSTLTATGIYGSAARFISVGNLLLVSIFGASYTRFFRHGASGIRGSLKFAKRLLPVVILYGVVSLLGYLVFAPFLPTILGEEYRNAIEALRWLAPLPAIAGLQHLAANTLTGAGHQKARSIVQVTSALLNIGLNFWLIPLYGWKGAAGATLISDSLRLIFVWLIVIWLTRRAVKQERILGQKL